MEAVLLVGGLSLYLLATTLLLRDTYLKHPVWTGFIILVPPVALVYYFLSWRRSWPLFTLQTASLALTLLAGVLVIRAEPQRFEHTFLAALRDQLAPAYRCLPMDVSRSAGRYATTTPDSSATAGGHG